VLRIEVVGIVGGFGVHFENRVQGRAGEVDGVDAGDVAFSGGADGGAAVGEVAFELGDGFNRDGGRGDRNRRAR
jgi:hypothetical protein